MTLCASYIFLVHTVVTLKLSNLLQPANISKGLWYNVLDRGML